MRWFSANGEFAFLSIGGAARGVIAIGGVAHGVVAVGAIASAGVVSIGMNAGGSVVAIGMNAVGPICFSLINGLGIYTRAGVNAGGLWSHGGTNATGMVSQGGVNSGQSWLPAAVVIVALIVMSSVLRGKRASRRMPGVMSLGRFLSAPEITEATVRARLTAVRSDGLELGEGRHSIAATSAQSVMERARAILASAEERPAVLAELARSEERVLEERPREEASYRERPRETTRTVVSCSSIAPAPVPESWLPKDMSEVQWVIAWTARLAAAVAIVILVVVTR